MSPDVHRKFSVLRFYESLLRMSNLVKCLPTSEDTWGLWHTRADCSTSGADRVCFSGVRNPSLIFPLRAFPRRCGMPLGSDCQRALSVPREKNTHPRVKRFSRAFADFLISASKCCSSACNEIVEGQQLRMRRCALEDDPEVAASARTRREVH